MRKFPWDVLLGMLWTACLWFGLLILIASKGGH